MQDAGEIRAGIRAARGVALSGNKERTGREEMSSKWYMRNPSGKIYGPIEMETLKGWVRDGRVEPLAGISNDLQNWVLAPMKPELEMNWVVENNPGQFYGPTHRKVLDDLKKVGSLTAAARYYWDDRGALAEKMREFENALSMKDLQISQSEVTKTELRKAVEKRDLQLEESRKAIQERDGRLDEMVSLMTQKDLKIEGLHRQIEQKDREAAELNAAIQAKCAELAEMENLLRKKESEKAELADELERTRAVHDREWKTEAVTPEVVLAETPPPVACHAFASLKEMEQAAQREISRLGAGGLRGFLGSMR